MQLKPRSPYRHEFVSRAADGIRVAVKADTGSRVTSDWMFWPKLQTGEVVRVLED